MFCPQCRTELPDDVKYCVKCGYDFSRVKTSPLKRHSQDSLDGVGTSFQEESDIESLQVGSLFAERYEILSQGIKGGMGAVYKCKDIMLNRIKALKIIHPRLVSSKQAISRFRQEVAISQELQHENIVRVYDIEERHGKEYFTMEWVEGRTLRDVIIERKIEKMPFTIEEAYRMISQVSEALEHAHKYTIHRDIKPENILVSDEKELKVKLSDFGIAKMLSPSQFTSTSMQMGTPYYMAPEQKVDTSNIDRRADIYALGVVLFELLTLENTIGLELPSELNKDLPSIIDAIIKKAVATKPEDRYADARELSDALKEVIDRFSEQGERNRKEADEQKEEVEKIKLEDETQRAEERKRKEEEQITKAVGQETRQKAEYTPAAQQITAHKKRPVAISVIVGVVVLLGIILTYKFTSQLIEQPRPSQRPKEEERKVIPSASFGRQEIRDFIADYYEVAEKSDINRLLGYYADSVDYYSKGFVKKDFIKKDKEYYFKRWPKTINTIEGQVEIRDTQREDIKLVQFITSFQVQNSQKTVKGKAENAWKLQKMGTGLKIIDEKQNVLSRETE